MSWSCTIKKSWLNLKNDNYKLTGSLIFTSDNLGQDFDHALIEKIQSEWHNFKSFKDNTLKGYVTIGNTTPYLGITQEKVRENHTQRFMLSLGQDGTIPIACSYEEDLREILRFYESHSNKLVNAFLDTAVSEKIIKENPLMDIYV